MYCKSSQVKDRRDFQAHGRNISQMFVHPAGQRQPYRARMSEEEGSPRCHSIRGIVKPVGDLVVWEAGHLGSGFVTVTNSLGDNELGVCLHVCKMKKVD